MNWAKSCWMSCIPSVPRANFEGARVPTLFSKKNPRHHLWRAGRKFSYHTSQAAERLSAFCSGTLLLLFGVVHQGAVHEALDILPALKDRNSSYETRMSARENDFCRVDVALVRGATSEASPLPHSETLQPFRAAAAIARRTGLG